MLNSRFNSWNRTILRFHQGSTSWIRSRIEIKVDSSDLAQTWASLGRLASLLRVCGFTKIMKRRRFEAELLPYSQLRAVLKLSYSPHLVSLFEFCFESPHSYRHRWPLVAVLVVAGPLSSIVITASLVFTCTLSFASRHDAKVISPLLSWPNSCRGVSFPCNYKASHELLDASGWLCIFHYEVLGFQFFYCWPNSEYFSNEQFLFHLLAFTFFLFLIKYIAEKHVLIVHLPKGCFEWMAQCALVNANSLQLNVHFYLPVLSFCWLLIIR